MEGAQFFEDGSLENLRAGNFSEYWGTAFGVLLGRPELASRSSAAPPRLPPRGAVSLTATVKSTEFHHTLQDCGGRPWHGGSFFA